MISSPLFKHNETEHFVVEENLAKIYPKVPRKDLLKWLVTPPESTYLRVNISKTSRSELIKKVKEITGYVDIEEHELLKDVIVIKGALNEEQPLEQVKESIIVGSGCASAVLRGAEIFAPGVIGAPKSLDAGQLVNVYADLNNKLLKGSTEFNLEDYVYIGQGNTCLSRADLFKKGVQAGLAVTMTSTLSKCPRVNDESLKQVRDLYFMQNLPSILAVHQLDIGANDKCLDMCAAPGGKTTHIATLLGENGQVLAFDKSKAKIDQILANGKRLGVENQIIARVQDATKAELEEESFDKVLLDAPCSALGQRPMLVQESRVKEIKSFAKLQRKLFEKAVQVLKPGGILVYSTCTITLEENEQLVDWAVQKFDLKLCKLNGAEHEGVKRFGPDDNEDTIGFFIAKFQKGNK